MDTFPFWEDISASKLYTTVCIIEGDVFDIPCRIIFSVAATAADFLNWSTSLYEHVTPASSRPLRHRGRHGLPASLLYCGTTL